MAHSVQADAAVAPRASGIERTIVIGLIVGGTLLAIAAAAAMVGIVVRMAGSTVVDVPVTAQRDPASLRAEALSVFGNFDVV